MKKLEGLHSTQKTPEEFHISNYNVCASWGLQQWTDALLSRWRIRVHWKLACQNGTSDKAPAHLIQNVRDTAKKMLSHPLTTDSGLPLYSPHTSPIKDQSAYNFFSDADIINEPEYLSWHARFKHALYYHFAEDEDGNEVIEGEFEKSIASDIQLVLETPAWKMHREVSKHPKDFMISVNLGASNELLMKEFKDWIKKTRKEANIPQIHGFYDNDDFEVWHRERLLPLMDLMFWADVHKESITQAQIGLALFPNDYERDLGEKIRKTTIPNAKKLISKEVVLALTYQVHNFQKNQKNSKS
ncbi:hypothetical protein H8K32_16670 [Undibacterium jejuense]|uniref:Uncharacterized protein n=1 Tax=Undibacterium jejuense TaxID=1344949 RepID=A0A923KQC4_9BURK|nr:DUF6387 family protein [Undibacterium jejuense]MBC3863743.1 hypothetical protein [Undibacterium jejuense]